MYTVRIPLKLNSYEERFLSKSFFFSDKIHNSLVKVGQKRLNAIMNDKIYRQARLEYGESGFSKKKANTLSKAQKVRRKELIELMQSKVMEYKLLSKDFDAYVSTIQKKYRNYVSSHQAQAEVKAVYSGIQKVLYDNGTHLHFKRYNQFDCIKQKNSTNGVKLRNWSQIEFMKHKYNLNPSHSTYMQEIMNTVDIQNDVVYSFLKRIEFNSGFHYYAIVTLKGEAPYKKHLSSNDKARTGVDLGTSSIATVSTEKVNLVELAPLSMKYEKEIRQLQKLVERSMRIHNPNNYKSDGTIKKGKNKKWNLTKRCKRLKRKIRILYRKQSAYILTSHNTFINQLLSSVDELYVEPMVFSSLQKRSKKTERSEKLSTVKKKDGSTIQIHKIKKKKRYGKSIKNRSPSLMQQRLKEKTAQYGIPYYEIDRQKFRASQFHHDTGEYIKSLVNERTKCIDGHTVQRDLYSAFLISNADNTSTQVDMDLCDQNFLNFVELHDEAIAKMKEQNISFKQCFGF